MKKTSLTHKESLIKRVQYHRYGGPEVLRVEEFALPEPGRGQIRVRVRAAAASPMDWKIRNGEMTREAGFVSKDQPARATHRTYTRGNLELAVELDGLETKSFLTARRPLDERVLRVA